MEKSKIIYSQDNHKVILLKIEDEELMSGHIGTNQYLIISDNEAVLLDPGGRVSFADVYEECIKHVKPKAIKYIFLSHQDPDVGSSLPEWMQVTPAKVILSKLWSRFISQFGITDSSRFIEIEDSGYKLTLANGKSIKFLPAHFLHSISNFHIYDETSKILFTVDLCASIMNFGEDYDIVEDFTNHIPHMQAFHERYMCSNLAIKEWIRLVHKLNISMLAPQHGAIIPKKFIKNQFEWLLNLKCGIDFIKDRYKTQILD